MPSRRERKRSTAVALELEQDRARDVASASVRHASNEELFVLDNKPASINNNHAAEVIVEKADKVQAVVLSNEAKKIKKWTQLHDKETLQHMVLEHKKRKNPRVVGNVKASFDLWKNEEPKSTTDIVVASKPALGPKKKKNKPKKLIHAGQSYRPDHQQHQNVLGEALAMELQRKQQVKEINAPMDREMSLETKRILIRDDCDDDDSDDDDDDDGASLFLLKQKKPEKRTKAQRNKQKRVRDQEGALQARKKQKQFNHSLEELKSHVKVVKKQEVEQEERRRERALLLKEKETQENSNDNKSFKVKSIPVVLSKDVSGLRRLKPQQGHLLLEQQDGIMAQKFMKAPRALDERKKKKKKTKKRVYTRRNKEYVL